MSVHGEMRAKLIKAIEAQSPAQTADVLADLIRENESHHNRILALETVVKDLLKDRSLLESYQRGQPRR